MSDPATPILPLRLQTLGYRPGSRTVLQGVDLTVNPGGVLIVLGPNGAGKSVLLRLCHGLLQPSEGSVRWASGERRPAAQAMLLQTPVLLRRSVIDNIAYPLQLAGMERRERAGRVTHALERFGLEALAKRPARALSGGEQQRVAFARAWVMQPQILFLDEPTAALDPSATRSIETLIRQCADDGLTLVMTTHDLGQARRLADRVAFLHHGRILEQGPGAAFFQAPATAEARAFLSGDLLWSTGD